MPAATSQAKVHEFSKSLVAEKQVLAQVADFWKDCGFRSVTEEVAFQSRDVDYVYTPKRAAGTLPAEVWVEVKCDGTPYHNIFLELISNGCFDVDTPGCFMFSQAYAWVYVFDQSKEMFVFDLQAVRDWVFKNFVALKPYLKATTNIKPDGSYAPTMGIAFPVERFLTDLASVSRVAYARLPGFGEAVNGVVPRSRLPAKFQHLNKGLDGVLALLDAAPVADAATPVKQFQPQTSRLRHKIIAIKELALTQTNNMFDSVKKRALGPHYAPEPVCA